MKLFLALVTCLLFSASSLQAQAPQTYQDAARLANQQNKIMFVYFYTEPCDWCTRMYNETIKKPDISKTLSDYYVVYYVHARREPGIVSAYRPIFGQRLAFPCYAFVSFRNLAKPVLVAHDVGYKDHDDFVTWYNNNVAEK